MPTELEELVEFIHHGNSQIRQLAVGNLVPYSLSEPAIFKTNQYLPVRDLKLLVRDYEPIAKYAIEILINLSDHKDVREQLAPDDEFIKTLITRITSPTEPHSDLLAMLLANLAKHSSLERLLKLELPSPPALQSTTLAISQLMDVFVRGATGAYNKAANFDYLAYLFADIAQSADGRKYFLTRQEYDSVVPFSKLVVFTEHSSGVRRKGVASTIKNCAFDVDSHGEFLNEEGINILPYILLPITGPEEFKEEEMLELPEDLQLLGKDKRRDSDAGNIQTHVETLMLLTTTRIGRDILRANGVYYVIRECHLAVEDDGVREACERLVQVLMRDEEGEEVSGDMKALERIPVDQKPAARGGYATGSWTMGQLEAPPEDDEDEDDQIVEV